MGLSRFKLGISALSLAILGSVLTWASPTPHEAKFSPVRPNSTTELSGKVGQIFNDSKRLGTTTKRPFPGVMTSRMKSPAKAPGKIRELYGSLLDSYDGGIYSYDIPTNQFSPVKLTSDLFANGGGVATEDTYYSIKVQELWGWYFIYGYEYNLETWEQITYTSSLSEIDIAYDFAYDSTSGKVYGSYIGDEYSGSFWGEMNLSTMKSTRIATLEKPLVAIACNPDGQFYGISAEGDFYKVDKTSGQLLLIGNTGVQINDIPQSATFDLKNNTLYWSACRADETNALYTVNVISGKAELVDVFEGEAPFVGMYIPTPEAEFDAPAAVSDLAVNFPNGATSGNVTFTIPTLTYGGETLTGAVNYTLRVNDQSAATGAGTPGQAISVPLTLSPGQTKFTLRTSNIAGESPEAEYSCFIGNDGPTAVTNIKVNNANGIVTISWDAPTTSINGGYFDPAALRYNVVRLPDNKVIAQNLSSRQITDELSAVELTAYKYAITPFNGDLEGVTANSPGVVVGEYCSIPYHEDFSDNSTWDFFTVINVDNDRQTWEYFSGYYGGITGDYAVIDYDFTNPKNDWLITPALKLEADCVYRLKFKSVSKRTLPEKLEVRFGTDNTVDGMTTVILEPTEITTDEYITEIYKDWEFEIPVTVSGLYYIGFHACSEVYMSRLYIGDIVVEEAGRAEAPEAPSDLTLIPGEKGALEVTASAVVPSKTINGDDLHAIEKMEFYVNDVLQKTFENPTPGEKLTAVLPTIQGDNTVMVKAYNIAGQGLEAKDNVYTGVVVPNEVTNLTLKYENGKAILSWTAPTSGVNGGYIDPEALEYMIYRNDYTYTYCTGTEYVDDLSDYDVKDQTIISYYVYPRSAAGMGTGVSSNAIVIGNGVYSLPYKESFPNGYTSNGVWGVTSTTETSWHTTTRGLDVTSYDGDNGMAYFLPRGPQESSLIYTGHFSLAGTANPALSMYVYNAGTEANKLEILATTNYADYDVLTSVVQGTDDLKKGWNQIVVDLNKYKGEPWVAFAFRGTSAASNWEHSMYIDCIEIYDNLKYNIGIDEFDAPAAISFGSSGTFGGVITNYGSENALSFDVNLYANNEIVESKKIARLLAGASETFTFTTTPVFDMAPYADYKIVVDFAADENLTNNTSDTRKVLIVVPEYNTVTTLEGEISGNGEVTLNWEMPEPDEAPQSRLESFEDYTPFIIENIGDWKLVDVDGEDGTLGIAYNGSNVIVDNVTLPHAYQVYNAEKAGLGSQIGLDAFLPHTGEQYLTSWQDTDGECDDWLISPELSGDAQVISFYVKTPVPNYGFETFEVLYSTTGNDIDDFVKVDGIKEEAFMTWEQVAAYLPEGAKYFAIRHTSVGKWVLAIDDIRFVAKGAQLEKLNVTGFKIYRDNVLIGTINGTDKLTFIDTNLKDGQTYTYAVTTLYEQGESGYSNRVTITANSGVVEMSAYRMVKGGKGYIDIIGASGQDVKVVSVDGKVISSGVMTSDNERSYVNNGVYIVTIAEKAYKVIVK